MFQRKFWHFRGITADAWGCGKQHLSEFCMISKKKDFNSQHSKKTENSNVIAPFSDLILACLAKKKKV